MGEKVRGAGDQDTEFLSFMGGNDIPGHFTHDLGGGEDTQIRAQGTGTRTDIVLPFPSYEQDTLPLLNHVE
jgi:hypothetical protein